MTSASPSALRQLSRLLRPYRTTVTLCVVLGALGGLSVTAMLAAINHGLNSPEGFDGAMLLAFGGLCLLTLTGSIVSDIGTNSIGQRIIAALRKDLAARILSAPISQIERYRSHRLIPVLTHDVDTISDFAFVFASVAVAATIVLGCLVYMAWLSPVLFLVAALAIGIGMAAQSYARHRGVQGFFAAREEEDALQKHYRAIAEGAKELRVNRPRRLRLHARINDTVDKICRIQVRSITLYVSAKALGSALFFLVIAVVLAGHALLPGTAGGQVVSGFVLVLLYMKGPVEQIVSALPALGRARVAFGRIAELAGKFADPEGDLLLPAATAAPTLAQGIELSGVRYRFDAQEGAAPFELGPIDLSIRPGRILFIVGENGSGKTTLIKLLLGLYAPTAGEVRCDGALITPATRDAYRQQFTTVFADYYLFDDLVYADASMPADATAHLERLELAHKVSIQDGHFSTTDLSTGQRKRLALVHAWLEGRPVVVFDEWAADQDPAFRRVFYAEILPALRAQGKAIVVISHDDRYFDAADDIITLRGGKAVAAEGLSPAPAAR